MTFSDSYQQLMRFLRNVLLPSPTLTYNPIPIATAHSVKRHNLQRRLFLPILLILLIAIISGCQGVPGTFPGLITPQAGGDGTVAAPAANAAIPTQPPAIVPDIVVVVNTVDQRANVRSGPGLEFEIIGKAEPQTTLNVVGRNDEGGWWQICCLTDEGSPAADGTTLGWVAESVVNVQGDATAVPFINALLPEQIAAEWRVDWSCGSERCEIQECSATVGASVGNIVSQQWLRLDHAVSWDDSCFPTDEWIFEVNRITGQERTGNGTNNFLYGYWVGPQPDKINSTFLLPDGRQVAAWCSGPYEVEIEEGGGWATVYEGTTCHDVRTGILLSLNYQKRWLFTGEFDGETYERQYFGDFETLEQSLATTTVELQFVGQQ